MSNVYVVRKVFYGVQRNEIQPGWLGFIARQSSVPPIVDEGDNAERAARLVLNASAKGKKDFYLYLTGSDSDPSYLFPVTVNPVIQKTIPSVEQLRQSGTETSERLIRQKIDATNKFPLYLTESYWYPATTLGNAVDTYIPTTEELQRSGEVAEKYLDTDQWNKTRRFNTYLTRQSDFLDPVYTNDLYAAIADEQGNADPRPYLWEGRKRQVFDLYLTRDADFTPPVYFNEFYPAIADEQGNADPRAYLWEGRKREVFNLYVPEPANVFGTTVYNPFDYPAIEEESHSFRADDIRNKNSVFYQTRQSDFKPPNFFTELYPPIGDEQTNAADPRAYLWEGRKRQVFDLYLTREADFTPPVYFDEDYPPITDEQNNADPRAYLWETQKRTNEFGLYLTGSYTSPDTIYEPDIVPPFAPIFQQEWNMSDPRAYLWEGRKRQVFDLYLKWDMFVGWVYYTTEHYPPITDQTQSADLRASIWAQQKAQQEFWYYLTGSSWFPPHVEPFDTWYPEYHELTETGERTAEYLFEHSKKRLSDLFFYLLPLIEWSPFDDPFETGFYPAMGDEQNNADPRAWMWETQKRRQFELYLAPFSFIFPPYQDSFYPAISTESSISWLTKNPSNVGTFFTFLDNQEWSPDGEEPLDTFLPEVDEIIKGSEVANELVMGHASGATTKFRLYLTDVYQPYVTYHFDLDFYPGVYELTETGQRTAEYLAQEDAARRQRFYNYPKWEMFVGWQFFANEDYPALLAEMASFRVDADPRQQFPLYLTTIQFVSSGFYQDNFYPAISDEQSNADPRAYIWEKQRAEQFYLYPRWEIYTPSDFYQASDYPAISSETTSADPRAYLWENWRVQQQFYLNVEWDWYSTPPAYDPTTGYPGIAEESVNDPYLYIERVTNKTKEGSYLYDTWNWYSTPPPYSVESYPAIHDASINEPYPYLAEIAAKLKVFDLYLTGSYLDSSFMFEEDDVPVWIPPIYELEQSGELAAEHLLSERHGALDKFPLYLTGDYLRSYFRATPIYPAIEEEIRGGDVAAGLTLSAHASYYHSSFTFYSPLVFPVLRTFAAGGGIIARSSLFSDFPESWMQEFAVAYGFQKTYQYSSTGFFGDFQHTHGQATTTFVKNVDAVVMFPHFTVSSEQEFIPNTERNFFSHEPKIIPRATVFAFDSGTTYSVVNLKFYEHEASCIPMGAFTSVEAISEYVMGCTHYEYTGSGDAPFKRLSGSAAVQYRDWKKFLLERENEELTLLDIL